MGFSNEPEQMFKEHLSFPFDGGTWKYSETVGTIPKATPLLSETPFLRHCRRNVSLRREDNRSGNSDFTVKTAVSRDGRLGFNSDLSSG